MNQIRAIQELNRKEIEQGITSDASWHTDYRDTAYVYFGGIPYELTEGDVITIFSQYGEPVFLKLVRDRETGRSKGFGWLKYEDQRSTDLAVDNLGGAEIAGRMVRVDHARYKPHEEDEPDEGRVDWAFLQKQQGRAAVSEDGDDGTGDSGGSESNVGRPPRPLLKEEKELAALMEGHDDDDPMKGFLVEEKKKEVEEARVRERERNSRKDRDRDDGEGSRRHHHHHHKRRRHDDDEDDESRDRGRRREDRHDDPDKKRQRRERSGDDDADRRRRRDRDRDGDGARERGRDRRSDRDRDRDHTRRDDRSAERGRDSRRRRSRSREKRHKSRSRSRSASRPRRDL